MTPLIYFIAAQFMGGAMFFVGLAATCLTASIGFHVQREIIRSVLRIGTLVGAIFVVLSATPISLWAYAGWLVALVATIAGLSRRTAFRYVPLALLAVVSFIMAAYELPRHKSPQIDAVGCKVLYVVGDSLSFGADPGGQPWPELLGTKIGLPARNLSFGGAMLDSALDNAKRIDRDDGLIILEIGGNDLLKGRDDFEENLQIMLDTVCRSNRRVVMIELPLPPFYNSYGLAQRQLAAKYGVTLIPKRFLAGVLAMPGATVDGLHFSNTGHERMATAIRALIHTAP